MNSIKTRLNISLVISLLLLVAVSWYATSAAIQDLTDNYIKDRLEIEVESLLAELKFDDVEKPYIDQKKVDGSFQRALSHHYFQILIQSNEDSFILRSKSLQMHDLDFPHVEHGESLHFRTRGPKKELLFILVKGFRISKYLLIVAIAEDLTPYQKDLRSFQLTFSIIAILFITAIITMQWLILHYSFKPIDRSRNNILSLRHGLINKLDQDVPIEMLPFVNKINDLIKKTNDYLLRSRNTISNLSHAIKTPLTMLAQLTDHPHIKADPAIHMAITNNTNILFDLIERQLKRARLTDPDILGSSFTFAKEFPLIANTLKTLYYDKHILLDTHIPPDLIFEVDRQDLIELIGNLLDNAFKWSKSQVIFSAGNENQFWITIEDDGPGVSADKMERIVQRGVRLDESKIGSGLGLSICKDIVDQYDGTLSYGRSSELKGFSVHVEIPHLEGEE